MNTTVTAGLDGSLALSSVTTCQYYSTFAPIIQLSHLLFNRPSESKFYKFNCLWGGGALRASMIIKKGHTFLFVCMRNRSKYQVNHSLETFRYSAKRKENIGSASPV